jgi:hypothetical protein
MEAAQGPKQDAPIPAQGALEWVAKVASGEGSQDGLSGQWT